MISEAGVEVMLDPAPFGKARSQIMKLKGAVGRRIVPDEQPANAGIVDELRAVLYLAGRQA